MKVHWADKFRERAVTNGIDCSISKFSKGWIETMLVGGRHCFVKSFTYDRYRKQYFQGVDPAKLLEQGDFVLLCGGSDQGELRDIFIIPWAIFFDNLRTAPAIGTYKDRDYNQYKFYVRDRKDTWFITFEKGNRFDVVQWRYDLAAAIDFFKPTESSGSQLAPESDEEVAREFGYNIDEEEFREGKTILRAHLAKERDPALTRNAKQTWLHHDGGDIKCSVCNFSFSKVYGPIGHGFI